MTFQYISVYLTVLLHQFLTAESQYLPSGAFPFPPGASPIQMPGMPMPPNMLMPGHMPGAMPFPMPQQRMPMVAMPYFKSGRKPVPNYMKKPKRKHIRKKKHFDDSTSSGDTSDNSDSSDFNYRNGKRNRKPKDQRRRQVLTPVVSYVTKEGYVIYQKKIKKDRAKDWLEMEKRQQTSSMVDDDREQDESRESYKETKRRHRFSKKSPHDY